MSTSEVTAPEQWTRQQRLSLFALCVALFANSFSMTVLFPFVGFMVKHMGVTQDDTEVGFSAGYIAGAFMFGRIPGSIVAGVVADRYGRRPLMILGLVDIIITSTLFGLSESLAWAIATRAVMGLFNAIVVISKTMASELCGPSQQATAMSLVGALWGVGLVIGPAVGGLLAEPADKFPLLDIALFRTYPYLLPCLVSSAIAVLSLITVLLWLPETLRRKAAPGDAASGQRFVELVELRGDGSASVDGASSVSDDDSDADDGGASDGSGSRVGDSERGGQLRSLSPPLEGAVNAVLAGAAPSSGVDSQGVARDARENVTAPPNGRLTPATDSDATGSAGDSAALLCAASDASDVSDTVAPMSAALEDVALEVHEQEGAGAAQGDLAEEGVRGSRLGALAGGSAAKPGESLCALKPMLTCTIYTVWSLIQIMIDEVFPLWALAPLDAGGLAMDSTSIGSTLALMGVALMLFQLYFFPRFAKRFGLLNMFRCGVALQLPVLLAYPLVPKIATSGAAVYGLVIAISFLKNSIALTVFTANFLLINNSVAPTLLGSVNGLSMTLSSIGKAVGPIMGGSLFAWSVSSPRPYPFNVHFVFVLGGILILMLLCMTAPAPKSLNRPLELDQPLETAPQPRRA